MRYISFHYIGELKQADANITLMVQADMLAYHVPGETPQLGLPERYEPKRASEGFWTC